MPLRVMITGGSRGIGRAIALRFARAGAHVAVAARNSTELDAVVKEIDAAGGKGRAQQMNVADHGTVEAGVFRSVEFLGGAIDLLVNCAGVFDVKPLARMDLATWNRNIDVNLNGPFYVTLEALDALLAGHRPMIVNVASIAARRGFAGNAAYCASKWGLRGFSEAIRLDLAPQGVRVTTLYPGPTDTTIFDKVPGDWDRSKMQKPEAAAEAVWQAYHAPEGAPIDDVDVPPLT
ncbi:MAG: SDR family oxidoreductase [Planctomycetes bacterium]|nr:SDR family oxidoreductase [Planctomycetota bacterium]